MLKTMIEDNDSSEYEPEEGAQKRIIEKNEKTKRRI